MDSTIMITHTSRSPLVDEFIGGPGTTRCRATATPGRGSSRLVHHAPLVARQVLGVGLVGEVGAVGEEEQGLGVVRVCRTRRS